MLISQSSSPFDLSITHSYCCNIVSLHIALTFCASACFKTPNKWQHCIISFISSGLWHWHCGCDQWHRRHHDDLRIRWPSLWDRPHRRWVSLTFTLICKLRSGIVRCAWCEWKVLYSNLLYSQNVFWLLVVGILEHAFIMA